MKASPTRKALTPHSRIRATSAGVWMPLSVTSSRSSGTARSRSRVVSRRGLEGAQVAIVDADQRRRQAPGRAPARPHRAPRPARPCPARVASAASSASCASLERRDDQQDAVGAQGPRLVHLIGVDHEVLAQHRQRTGRARRLQVGIGALKEVRVGEHRQAGRAIVAHSERAMAAGSKSARSTPLLGEAFLISAITAGTACRHAFLEGGGKAARRAGRRRALTHLAQDHAGAPLGDLFGLAAQDALRGCPGCCCPGSNSWRASCCSGEASGKCDQLVAASRVPRRCRWPRRRPRRRRSGSPPRPRCRWRRRR